MEFYIREYPPPPNNLICKQRIKAFLKCFAIIFAILLIIGLIGLLIKKLNDNKNDKDKEEHNEINSTEEEIEIPKEPIIIPEDYKENKQLIITDKQQTRISLLKDCMKAYGVEESPILKEENYTENNVSNDKILSISTLEMDFNKGKSVEIFKSDFELEVGEYACISYESKGINHMIKINEGIFSVPDDFEGDISETPFTFILYFNYDPSINEYDTQRELESINNEKALNLYNKEAINKNKYLRRKLSIFSKIKNIFQKNVKTIVEKAIEKTVSYACVSLIKCLFQEFYNVIIKGISQYACDELGEFAEKKLQSSFLNLILNQMIIIKKLFMKKVLKIIIKHMQITFSVFFI